MLLFDYVAGLVKANFYPPSKCFHVSCSLLPLTWFCAIICLSRVKLLQNIMRQVGKRDKLEKRDAINFLVQFATQNCKKPQA